MPDRRRAARVAFGRALTEALRPRQQKWLGDLLGNDQATVSNWMRGKNEPPPWTVFEVEALLDLAPGELSRHLGYMPVGVSKVVSVRAAVDSDDKLDRKSKRALLSAYRSLTESEPSSET